MWTPGASKLQSNQLQSGLILKVYFFPPEPLCYVTVPSVVCFQGSSFNTKYFSACCSHPFYFFPYSSPSPFHLGKRSYEKRSSILAEALNGAGNRILDPWPPTPQAQKWDHPWVSWLSPERLPRTVCALGRFCLLEHRALLARRGFPLFFPAHPPLPLPEELVLTKFRKVELHW